MIWNETMNTKKSYLHIYRFHEFLFLRRRLRWEIFWIFRACDFVLFSKRQSRKLKIMQLFQRFWNNSKWITFTIQTKDNFFKKMLQTILHFGANIVIKFFQVNKVSKFTSGRFTQLVKIQCHARLVAKYFSAMSTLPIIHNYVFPNNCQIMILNFLVIYAQTGFKRKPNSKITKNPMKRLQCTNVKNVT